VSKRVASRYHAGERTWDWFKVKCWRAHRFVFGGMERDDEGRLAALLVGSPDGDEGRVEFGLHRVAEMWKDRTSITRSPFGDQLADRGRTWLAPRSLIEIRALPRPDGGRSGTPRRFEWFHLPASLVSGQGIPDARGHEARSKRSQCGFPPGPFAGASRHPSAAKVGLAIVRYCDYRCDLSVRQVSTPQWLNGRQARSLVLCAHSKGTR